MQYVCNIYAIGMQYVCNMYENLKIINVLFWLIRCPNNYLFSDIFFDIININIIYLIITYYIKLI